MPNLSRPLARRPRPVVVSGLVACSIALLAGPALGWGRLGHRCSAQLTETLLTPATRDAIAALLDPGDSIVKASTWPDEIRKGRPETAPWHYVNVPITEPKYDPKYAKDGICVVSKIPDFVATLKDPKATRLQKQEAFKFLVHCVEDMHNPVHVGDRGDKGGNDLQVRFYDQGSNLHSVWDTRMLEHVDADEAKTLARLKVAFTPEFVHAAQVGTVEDWANESHRHSRDDAYVDPTSGQPLRPGAKLSDAYQAKNLPIVERRLLLASARLAVVLNEALDPAYVPTRP